MRLCVSLVHFGPTLLRKGCRRGTLSMQFRSDTAFNKYDIIRLSWGRWYAIVYWVQVASCVWYTLVEAGGRRGLQSVQWLLVPIKITQVFKALVSTYVLLPYPISTYFLIICISTSISALFLGHFNCPPKNNVGGNFPRRCYQAAIILPAWSMLQDSRYLNSRDN